MGWDITCDTGFTEAQCAKVLLTIQLRRIDYSATDHGMGADDAMLRSCRATLQVGRLNTTEEPTAAAKNSVTCPTDSVTECWIDVLTESHNGHDCFEENAHRFTRRVAIGANYKILFRLKKYVVVLIVANPTSVQSLASPLVSSSVSHYSSCRLRSVRVLQVPTRSAHRRRSSDGRGSHRSSTSTGVTCWSSRPYNGLSHHIKKSRV